MVLICWQVTIFFNVHIQNAITMETFVLKILKLKYELMKPTQTVKVTKIF